jgi:hypothetical protein
VVFAYFKMVGPQFRLAMEEVAAIHSWVTASHAGWAQYYLSFPPRVSLPSSTTSHGTATPSTPMPLLAREACLGPRPTPAVPYRMLNRAELLGLPELLRGARCHTPEKPWHALRHTFAAHAVMSGIPLYTVKELLGMRPSR